jgi:hypothetical protein
MWVFCDPSVVFIAALVVSLTYTEELTASVNSKGEQNMNTEVKIRWDKNYKL